MGIQSGVPWRWFTTATSASMRSRYSAYSGTSVRDGISCAMNVTFSWNSGCCSRNRSKALNPRRTDEPRERVEVVVVDHDDRLVLAVDLLDHRVGEVLVDDVVAVLERLDLVAPHVRRVAEVPEVVLDEPQHRVGEDVVEAVVGVGVGGDEPHLVLAAGRRANGERLVVLLARLLDVVLGEGAGDPDDLAMGREARQGGD